VIRVDRVSKRFGRTRAVEDVSFAIERGEVVGFVGPNGAGKTTTLRVITGFIDADAGTVQVAGHDVTRDRAAARAPIGYLPEAVPLYPEMRVREYLAFRARLKGIRRRDLGARVDEAMERVGIADHARRLVGRLSRGYRQRVGLADALVARPPILILDEPTSGLDPVQVREFRALMAELAVDRTVLLSSHMLSEVEAVAARMLVIVGGALVADDEPAALRRRVGLPDDAPFDDVFIELASGRDAGAA
jgi:ABC-2 type transport system ATP-binding protein